MPLLTLCAQTQMCDRCPHGSTRKQVVFAKGDPLSTLCFVGEAPGAEEDEHGLPFVGDSGKLLDKQIAAMREYAAAQGIEFPASPYVCNVLKCRPPGNKLLKDGSDIAACSEHLWAQLRSLPNLRVIVALGKTAAQTLLVNTDTGAFSTTSIGKLRGVSYTPEGLCRKLCDDESKTPDVVPTYHPSYLLRQPNDKALRLAVWSDLQRAVEGLR